jgi:hypothetical protein
MSTAKIFDLDKKAAMVGIPPRRIYRCKTKDTVDNSVDGKWPENNISLRRRIDKALKNIDRKNV